MSANRTAAAFTGHGRDTRWTLDAACADADPELFFAPENERGGKDDREYVAKQICGRCPVRAECAATNWEDNHAVVGGFTPDERRAIDKKRRSETR